MENAEKKIKNKGCDYIIANDISKQNSGFGSDYNEVYIVDRNLNKKFIERAPKEIIAKSILEKVFEQTGTNIEAGSVCT